MTVLSYCGIICVSMISNAPERNEFSYSRHGLEAEGTLTTKIVQVKVILKITDINDSD